MIDEQITVFIKKYEKDIFFMLKEIKTKLLMRQLEYFEH